MDICIHSAHALNSDSLLHNTQEATPRLHGYLSYFFYQPQSLSTIDEFPYFKRIVDMARVCSRDGAYWTILAEDFPSARDHRDNSPD